MFNISFVYSAPTPPIAAPPKPKPAVKRYKAKLAVVIDDCGYSMSLAEQLAAIKYPITFAVIPYTPPYGKETAKLARKAGKTVFIHFPMQPKSYLSLIPGKGGHSF